jgi:hypothetical protein
MNTNPRSTSTCKPLPKALVILPLAFISSTSFKRANDKQAASVPNVRKTTDIERSEFADLGCFVLVDIADFAPPIGKAKTYINTFAIVLSLHVL